MTRKHKIEAARNRIKRYHFHDIRDAYTELNSLMKELDDTRAVLAKLLPASIKDRTEAQDARSFLEN